MLKDWMVIEKFFVYVDEFVSITCTIKLDVPVAVGVPDITPVELLRVKPFGRVPVFDHVYGSTPPVAVRVWLYAVPSVPEGRGDEVVIVKGAIGIVVTLNAPLTSPIVKVAVVVEE